MNDLQTCQTHVYHQLKYQPMLKFALQAGVMRCIPESEMFERSYRFEPKVPGTGFTGGGGGASATAAAAPANGDDSKKK